MVHLSRPAWGGQPRRSRVAQQLLGDLVHADQRPTWVVGPGVDREDVFHPPDERATGLWRDAPLLAPPGLQLVFFEHPAHRLVGDGVDDLQLNQFVRQQPQGPARLSLRGRLTGQRNQMGFLDAIQFARVLARRGAVMERRL
jgi:hypothetical protein